MIVIHYSYLLHPTINSFTLTVKLKVIKLIPVFIPEGPKTQAKKWFPFYAFYLNFRGKLLYMIFQYVLEPVLIQRIFELALKLHCKILIN